MCCLDVVWMLSGCCLDVGLDVHSAALAYFWKHVCQTRYFAPKGLTIKLIIYS